MKKENLICTACRHGLPLTNYHRFKDNPVEKIFYGRVPVEKATAFLHFEKSGIVQKLIHQLKYRGQESLGTLIGEWMGTELATSPGFKDIDLVLPVPLHRQKERKRGYNQVSLFAGSLAKALNSDYDEKLLKRSSQSGTQTLKSRVMRWYNKDSSFEADMLRQTGAKHILLADDVITTGATLEACIKALRNAKNVKVSIAAMAITV
ncbi:ComF family protein [Leptobacterium flavescens]|uniref:ComF family protein n=1 Tax=Leptobacterium flavescens TaxID=472055 RepID=UPI001EF83B13|nr:phosphoribosyltransferase family protein [Leptobacterium flavescens]